jgi:phosphoserine phosphatase RsbX
VPGVRVGPVEVDVASMALAGERESGDRSFTLDRPDGTLVAAVDGLGHGHDAAIAADQAFRCLAGAPSGTSPSVLIGQCHVELQRTRGAAMCVAFFPRDTEVLEWMAVGNVEGRLIRGNGGRPEAVIQRPGIVGGTLPRLLSARVSVRNDDVLLLASDGVDPRFAGAFDRADGAIPTAEEILAAFATAQDDALVVVARYVGWQP